MIDDETRDFDSLGDAARGILELAGSLRREKQPIVDHKIIERAVLAVVLDNESQARPHLASLHDVRQREATPHGQQKLGFRV
jgi:hypothetical protein